MIVLYLVASLFIMSGLEYAIHRYAMHSRFPVFDQMFPTVFRDHSQLHHGKYFRVFDSEPDMYGRALNIESAYWWLTLIVLSPLIGCLWLIAPWFGITFVVIVLLHNFAWSMVHSEMHRPVSGSWLRRTTIYDFLEHWHRAHHDQPNRNFAVLTAFGWDWALGTRAR